MAHWLTYQFTKHLHKNISITHPTTLPQILPSPALTNIMDPPILDSSVTFLIYIPKLLWNLTQPHPLNDCPYVFLERYFLSNPHLFIIFIDFYNFYNLLLIFIIFFFLFMLYIYIYFCYFCT